MTIQNEWVLDYNLIIINQTVCRKCSNFKNIKYIKRSILIE